MHLKPIGVIHSPYKEKKDAPRQGRTKEEQFIIEIYPEYEAGLKDIEDASHLIVLYWFDKGDRNTLLTKTPSADAVHGVFATRSPNRPNPIAFDIVDLAARQENKLIVRGMDALDNSPLVDIKPYVAPIDAIPGAKFNRRPRAARD